MAGISSTPNNAIAALHDSLPDLTIINPNVHVQPETVKFNQRVSIDLRQSNSSETRILRRDGPVIYIHGLAKFHGDCLRLRMALEIEGDDEVVTPAKIFWKVKFVRSNAFEEIGEKTKLIKLPPPYVTTTSDDYLEIKLNDIKPSFKEGGFVELKWEASLVWFFDGPIVDPFHKVVFCCHQIYDILDTFDGKHKLHEEVEQAMDDADVTGLHMRE